MLKSFFRRLTLSIKKYNNVMSKVKPIVKPLLKAHIEAMEDTIGPGMEDLCWLSLGIDAYIKNMEKGTTSQFLCMIPFLEIQGLTEWKSW